MAKEVAMTLQPTAPPPAFPVSGETAGVLGGGVMALVGAILWLRRKTSRDGVELIKDRTEGKLLQTALEERDKAMAQAREAWSHRTTDAGTIGQLTAENDYLKRELDAARLQITEIRRGVMDIGKKVDTAQAGLVAVERKVGATNPAPLGRE